MKSTGSGRWRESFWRDEHLCPWNFLAEHIVSNRRKWVLLISMEQCYHCLRTIGFHNILRLLWSREWFWTVFHCLFSFDDSLEPRLLSSPEYHGHLMGCPRGVMVKAMNCGIVVREFVLQSRYYVHFRANTLGKGMNPLILPPAMGK